MVFAYTLSEQQKAKTMRIVIANAQDFIKASRKGSRDAEIEMYGHPINHTKIFRNKKKYTRKTKHKADNDNGLA